MPSLTLELRLKDDRVAVRLLENGTELAAATAEPSTVDLAALQRLIDHEANPTAEIPRYARALGALLAPQPVLDRWKARTALAKGEPIRTILDLGPGLESFPWEIAAAHERLFLSAQRPFVRRAAVAGLPCEAPSWPVDMLVVLGSHADELERIGGYQELRAIRDVLRARNRSVHLHVLDLNDADPQRRAGRARIVAALSAIKPHALHFIGHGSETGLDVLDPEGTKSWTKDAIRTDLGNAGFTPWLVYLNACRSLGRMPGDDRRLSSQFSELAAAFLSGGARAVVAMHADINGRSAAACAEAFYRALGAADPIDVALTRARVQVDQAVPGSDAGITESREAYLPVLIVAGDPDEALPRIKDRCEPPAGMRVSAQTPIATVVQELVNQDAGRRQLLGFRLERADRANVIAVHGDPDTGKSWLLAWCIDGWLRQGYKVRYVAMSGFKHWFDVMMAILAGAGEAPLGRNPLQLALSAFVQSLGLAPPVRAAKPRRMGGPMKLSAAARRKLESQIDLVGDSFADALLCSPPALPLIVVLDQFESQGERLDPVTFDLLMQHWIRPHVIDGTGEVSVVLGISNRHASSYPVPDGVQKLFVGPFPAERYIDLMDELLRARYPDDYQRYRALWEDEQQRIARQATLAKDLSEQCKAIDLVLKLRLPLAGRP